MKKKEKKLAAWTVVIVITYLMYLGYMYNVKLDIIDQHDPETLQEDDNMSVVLYKSYRDSMLSR